MIMYYDLPIPFRSLIILGLFLNLCMGGCLVALTFRKKKRLTKTLIGLGMVLSGTMMIIYTAEARANLRNLEVPAVSDWLCSRSVILPLGVFLLIFFNLVWTIREEYRFRKSVITRSSIKEGVDKLNTGLCFYHKGGRTILVNRCMNELCFAILGRDLQNGETFWESLTDGKVSDDVQRLSSGSRPDFRLADGSVWTFACDQLDSIFQITAANITQIQAVTEELKEENRKLAALNHRLKKHGENVDELTRSRERLEIKARIHSELGQALLSTRGLLLDESQEMEPPLDMWQRNIAMLRKEAELQEYENPLEMLERISGSTGIQVERSGDLPENEQIQKLFVQAAAEALTNAVRHAHAKKLYINLTENQQEAVFCFRNDGDAPDREIVEGGGLTSLRHKIEGEGGTMNVTAVPVFTLTVTIPKGKGDHV